jgi:ubiquinone/menaquinone biosynthesis C-methylase UbiE
MKPTTERFSDRVENYLKYRPSYPSQTIEHLTQACGLTSQWAIADVGSGTGILARLFLDFGNTVYGIEPNREMRTAAERLLVAYPNFRSIAGQAEQTTLGDRCVDCITAGQAFHWFNQAQARQEFARILRPGGWVVLIWNHRSLDTSPFLEGYEHLLKTYATDYESVKDRNVNAEQLQRFYASGRFKQATFPNVQTFDFEGLRGRLLSSSYVPNVGQLGYKDMMRSLLQLFETYQVQGNIRLEYETALYYGQLGSTINI